jgi:hypothetical protein
MKFSVAIQCLAGSRIGNPQGVAAPASAQVSAAWQPAGHHRRKQLVRTSYCRIGTQPMLGSVTPVMVARMVATCFDPLPETA